MTEHTDSTPKATPNPAHVPATVPAPGPASEPVSGPVAADTSQTTRPALTVDWDYFGSFLEGLDLSEDEARELIKTVWNIAVCFVDLGFGVHPAQLVVDQACEQNPETDTDLARVVVNYLQSINTDVEPCAAAGTVQEQERSPA